MGGLKADKLLILVEKTKCSYVNMNEAVMQFNISKLASAVETSWRGEMEIFSREYSAK